MNTKSVALALTAVAIWSFQGFLSLELSQLPAFLYGGIALTVGGLVSVGSARRWLVPRKILLVGVSGIFFYHVLFFLAFQLAPTVETNLLNYLWPLIMVLLTPAILPGSRLRWYHVGGAILGFIGAGLIATGGRLSLNVADLPGYLLITLAALIWAWYSLMCKKLQPFPSSAVGGFTFLSGLLMLVVYFFSYYGHWGEHVMTAKDWLYTMLLGAGPLGLGFIAWGVAVKNGDSKVIGSIAYLIPLASTFVLVMVGGKNFSLVSGIAMLLIVSGAVVGSLGLFIGSASSKQEQAASENVIICRN